MFLEIARAACLSLGRRLGPWLLGLAVLEGATHWFRQSWVPFGIGLVLLALVGGVVPGMVGTGLRRWLHGGPLGLASRGTGYWATVGYGLGGALVVLPFLLVMVALMPPARLDPGLLTATGWLLVAAWLGAASGRLANAGPMIVALSWLWGMAVIAGGLIAAVFAQEALPPAAYAALGSHALVAIFSVVMGGLTQLIVWGSARADMRLLAVRNG